MSARVKKIGIAPVAIGLLALILGGCATTTPKRPGITKAQVQAAKDRERSREPPSGALFCYSYIDMMANLTMLLPLGWI